MTSNTIPIRLYKEAAQVFHWATKRHFQLWFTGKESKRHRRTESVLSRLVKKNKLRSVKYGKRLIYSVPRKGRGRMMDEFLGLTKVVHGLACTECLVRSYRSRMDGEVIAERFFFGLGCVPEWGIRYPDGKLLLFEFCTKSNFLFAGTMKGKLSAYRRNIEKIENKFKAKAVILFVIDVPRETVERFVLGNGMSACGTWVGSVADDDVSALSSGDTFPSPFFFTDYKTFLSVPIGQQLSASIYFWGFDGSVNPLRKNAGL